jgi:hypothetical protein
MNPYANPKNMGIDYRFWDVFRSNFYPNQQEGQDLQMQYVD